MNIRTFPTLLVTFPKSSKKLAILLLSSQPLPGSVQTPSNFFICQFSSSFLWVPDKLITIANSDISANVDESHLNSKVCRMNKTARLNYTNLPLWLLSSQMPHYHRRYKSKCIRTRHILIISNHQSPWNVSSFGSQTWMDSSRRQGFIIYKEH